MGKQKGLDISQKTGQRNLARLISNRIGRKTQEPFAIQIQTIGGIAKITGKKADREVHTIEIGDQFVDPRLIIDEMEQVFRDALS